MFLKETMIVYIHVGECERRKKRESGKIVKKKKQWEGRKDRKFCEKRAPLRERRRKTRMREG